VLTALPRLYVRGIETGVTGSYATHACFTFRIAEIKQEIRPIAAVGLVVIRQARFTRGRVRHAMSTLDVVAATLSALRVDAKLVQTTGCTDRGHWNSQGKTGNLTAYATQSRPGMLAQFSVLNIYSFCINGTEMRTKLVACAILRPNCRVQRKHILNNVSQQYKFIPTLESVLTYPIYG
jgi:hypothetical protein